MSRFLPLRANLEWLKKAAKDRLQQMQEEMERTLSRYETLLRGAGIDPTQGIQGANPTGLVKLLKSRHEPKGFHSSRVVML